MMSMFLDDGQRATIGGALDALAAADGGAAAAEVAKVRAKLAL